VLRAAAGLLRLADAYFSIGDEVWQDASTFRPPHRRAIGFVFQEASLFAHMTVRRNLLYGYRRASASGAETKIQFDEVANLLGIEHLLERLPLHLSGGERQRVALGRALLSQPKLLLMDEPLSALDRTTKEEILPYLERIHAMFMERASSSNIATNIVAGSYRSAVGLRAADDLFWAGAYLTGPTAGTTHIFAPTATTVGSPGTLGSPGFSEQLGAVGRATLQLLQNENYSLHIGGDAQFLINPAGTHTLTLSDRPELRIDPTSIVSTGAIASISHAQVYNVEAAAGFGPLFFQGEYFWYDVERSFGLPSLHFNGWYAQGSWTITGEHRKYNPSAGSYAGIVPDYPFSWTTGGLGAWEIAARYSVVDLNDLFTPGIPTSVTHGVAGGTQGIYTVGLNWYVNRNIRIMVNYLHGSVDKFSGAAATAGADIGAKFDALAMRTQIAF
jgi:Phosphate-selective porin O and P/ABC transporter